MRHTHCYIVEPINGRYNNKKNVDNNELILNTSIEDHKFVNRRGVIIETPINNSVLQLENFYLFNQSNSDKTPVKFHLYFSLIFAD